jgi:hypothetical protein
MLSIGDMFEVTCECSMVLREGNFGAAKKFCPCHRRIQMRSNFAVARTSVFV